MPDVAIYEIFFEKRYGLNRFFTKKSPLLHLKQFLKLRFCNFIPTLFAEVALNQLMHHCINGETGNGFYAQFFRQIFSV